VAARGAAEQAAGELGAHGPSIDEYAHAREATQALVSGLTQAQLDFSPSAARWSVGELIDHVLIAERLYREDIATLIRMKREGRRPLLRRTFSDVDVAPAFLPKAVMPYLDLPFTMMNLFVPAAAREFLMLHPVLPIQNPQAARPRKWRPAAELRAELVSSLRQTRALFDANPDIDYRELISQHPMMGTNDVLQMLRFLTLHERRHQRQMRHAIADPRFPQAV
jgi:hypothetical protein